jgi:hypothetical protein
MDHAVWQNHLLDDLARIGTPGEAAVAYLRKHETRIGFRRARLSVGAFWTPLGSIYLNARRYTYTNSLADPYVLCLVIHEARHLQQGLFTALSVYGELEAWQLHFTVYHKLEEKPLHPAIAELLSLPLGWDRKVLQRARELMQDYASKKYRIDLLPLFPLGKELRHQLGLHIGIYEPPDRLD